MKREHKIEEMGEYIFYYPFEANGMNFGASAYSYAFKRFMAFGSTTVEPNFSDTLSHSTFDGKSGVSVSGLADKPVAMIDGVNLNDILNDNDFELGVQYVYRSHNAYDIIACMCRNSLDTKSNGLILSSGNTSLVNYVEWGNEIRLQQTSKIASTVNVWHSLTITKTGTSVKVILERLDNNTVILNQTVSWTAIPNAHDTYGISVLGDYFPNANKQYNTWTTNGMARELYLKIL